MKPRHFASPEDWRAWLAEHHGRAAEHWVGFYKRASGKPSMTWPESVDQALGVGWIDGIRKRVDAERYIIRFTARKSTSIWSRVNIAGGTRLEKQGPIPPLAYRSG